MDLFALRFMKEDMKKGRRPAKKKWKKVNGNGCWKKTEYSPYMKNKMNPMNTNVDYSFDIENWKAVVRFRAKPHEEPDQIK